LPESPRADAPIRGSVLVTSGKQVVVKIAAGLAGSLEFVALLAIFILIFAEARAYFESRGDVHVPRLAYDFVFVLGFTASLAWGLKRTSFYLRKLTGRERDVSKQ
jgi:hypothetical protein